MAYAPHRPEEKTAATSHPDGSPLMALFSGFVVGKGGTGVVQADGSDGGVPGLKGNGSVLIRSCILGKLRLGFLQGDQ